MVLRALILLLLLASSVGPAAAKRVALVVGNDAYREIEPLRKAVNDARAMSEVLSNLGFAVTIGENLTRREMSRKLSGFEGQVAPGDTAFLFFAGHGVQLGGENYLLPVDLPRPQDGDEGFVRDESHALHEIIGRLQSRGAAISMLVIDACRNNPLQRPESRGEGGTRGLARIEAPSGVFVLMSAGIGQVALDRLSDSDADPNSVFTRVLIPALSTPGIKHTQVAKRVQERVVQLAASVNHVQQPAFYDQVVGEVALSEAPPDREEAPVPRKDDQAAILPPPGLKNESQTSPAPVHDCDLQAASPADPQRPADVPGVALPKMDKPRAIVACREAVQQYAKEPRFAFALGRALGEAGQHAEAAGWYSKAADASYMVAINNLAALYADGKGVPQDKERAFVLMRNAAELGLTFAMNNVGGYYRDGTGTTVDHVKALEWFGKAAAGNDANAMVSIGFLVQAGRGTARSPSEAVGWFRKAAEAGEPRGMIALASAYEAGEGTAKDLVQAAIWYRLAADAGNVVGMAHLGRLYELGLGIGKDLQQALLWYRKAADAGDAASMTSVGLLYELGNGVNKDLAEAVRWYRKGAEAGDARAMNAMGLMLHYGSGVSQNQVEAVEWFTKAANAGDVSAMNSLGWVHEQGLGVNRNDPVAAGWYRKAADGGNVYAMNSLSWMYQQGRGVAKDEPEAARLAARAANAGYAGAMAHLGLMYENGTGVPKDLGQAALWYRKGADGGEGWAMFSLATLYRLGQGVPRDYAESLRLLDRAVGAGIVRAHLSLAIHYHEALGVGRDYAEAARRFLIALKGKDQLAAGHVQQSMRGWSRQALREMQTQLKQQGYYTGRIDGSFGRGMRAALEAYAR